MLELLVVLSIAAMLIALTPPLISSVVPGARAKSAALDLGATLRDARSQAISQGRHVDVVFQVKAARYSVGNNRFRELPEAVRIGAPDTELDFASESRSERRDSRESYTLRFYADGSSNGLKARLGSPGSGYVVAVDPLMGRVTVRSHEDDLS